MTRQVGDGCAGKGRPSGVGASRPVARATRPSVIASVSDALRSECRLAMPVEFVGVASCLVDHFVENGVANGLFVRCRGMSIDQATTRFVGNGAAELVHSLCIARGDSRVDDADEGALTFVRLDLVSGMGVSSFWSSLRADEL